MDSLVYVNDTWSSLGFRNYNNNSKMYSKNCQFNIVKEFHEFNWRWYWLLKTYMEYE